MSLFSSVAPFIMSTLKCEWKTQSKTRISSLTVHCILIQESLNKCKDLDLEISCFMCFSQTLLMSITVYHLYLPVMCNLEDFSILFRPYENKKGNFFCFSSFCSLKGNRSLELPSPSQLSLLYDYFHGIKYIFLLDYCHVMQVTAHSVSALSSISHFF